MNAYAQSQGIPYRNVLLVSGPSVRGRRAPGGGAVRVTGPLDSHPPPFPCHPPPTPMCPPPARAPVQDSWWYFKGYGDGVSNWTATPAVFPPGGDGALAALTQETGWQVIGHNRFWANDTVYAKANGGAWDFFIDPRGEGGMSVPLEQAFWEWLLPHSAKWGLRTYEQASWGGGGREGGGVTLCDPRCASTTATPLTHLLAPRPARPRAPAVAPPRARRTGCTTSWRACPC